MLKKFLGIKKLFILCMVAILIVSASFTGCITAFAASNITIKDLESAADFTWYNGAVTISQDTNVKVQGNYGLKLSMADKANWIGMTLALPSAGMLKDATSVIFYLKTPTSGSENFWFETIFQYAGNEIKYSQATTIYLQSKGSTEWTETTYWAGYGPNIPYGFEGYVKLPLNVPLNVSYSATGETEPKLELVDGLSFYFSNFGGENGDIYLDAISCEIPAAGEEMSVKVINNLESSDDIGWRDDSIAITTDSVTAVQGYNGLVFSMNDKATWKGFTVPMNNPVKLDEVDALYFYLKAPTQGTENFWFQIFYEYQGAQITHDGDFGVYLQAKGSSSWQKTTYWNGYGPNIPYGFEGYVKIPLTGKMKVNYTTTGETEAKLGDVTHFLLYFSNFGGESNSVTIDAFNAIKNDDGSVITESPLKRGDVNWDGCADSADLASLRKVIIKAKAEDLNYSDINSDGVVNVIDLIKLKKQLA